LTHQTSTDGLQFKLLAPASSDVPDHFTNLQVEPESHESLISEIQMVRGIALKECGPAGNHLLPDGRHFQPSDADSWHVVLQDGAGTTLGCARYRRLSGGPDQVAASHSSIAQSNLYGPTLKSGIEQLMTKAQGRAKHCGEVGGWALRPEIRGTMAAFNIALMTCALAEQLDCGVGITTATRMHRSSAILCRIGAQRLAEIPAYYEPKYGSIIEILHFDLPNINPRYASKLDSLRAEVVKTSVICARGASAAAMTAAGQRTSPVSKRLAA
jgi:hypothetical protein